MALALGGCTLVGVPPAAPGPVTEPGPAVQPGPAGNPGAVVEPGAAVVAGAAEPGPPSAPAPAAGPDPAPPPLEERLPEGEVRALWVVRTTLASHERIRRMVDEAAGAGFNTLFVQVRGRGDAYYASGVEPRAEALASQPAAFDPLALVLEEAHARGLRVHAWVNTFLVWGSGALPRDAGHVVRARPDLLAVPRALARELGRTPPADPRYVEALVRHARENAATVEGLFASPSAPEVRGRIVEVWRELATRYPLDGMHFDYVRYPSGEYDYSAPTLAAFRDWAAPRISARRAAELDGEAAADPLAWPRSLPTAWAEFREEAVTAVVREAAAAARQARPRLVVSAAVFADQTDARVHRAQDWPAWLSEGLLDVAAPMAYSTDGARFRGQIEAAVGVVGGRRVWAGIGAWQDDFEGTLAKIAAARGLGAGGFSLFSYDGLGGRTSDDGSESYLERLGRAMRRAGP